MFDTESVRNWLSQYQEMATEFEAQYERYIRLLAVLYGMGSSEISDMPRSPSPSNDKLTNLLSLKMELEDSQSELLRQQKIKRYQIEAVVNLLPKSEEKTVIRMRYVDGCEWNDITGIVCMDSTADFESQQRQTRRIHAKALNDFTDIVNSSKSRAVVSIRKNLSEN